MSGPWEDYGGTSADASGPWSDYAAATAATSPGPQSQPQGSGFDNFLRQAALTGRSAAEGVVGALALPNTIQNWEFNKLKAASNSVFGTNFDANRPNLTQQFSDGLARLGAYTPDSAGEQMSSAVTKGVTGALTGAGALGLGGLANAVRAGSSGATSAAASEGARQIGLPALDAVRRGRNRRPSTGVSRERGARQYTRSFHR